MIGMDSSPFVRGIICREKAWVQQADEGEADDEAGYATASDLGHGQDSAAKGHFDGPVLGEAVSNQVEEVRR